VFWWGNVRERVHLEYLGVDGRIIFKRIFKEEWGSVDWIDMAPYRGKYGFM
jgi:hypothetical protein